MVGKKDDGIQTEEQDSADIACQTDSDFDRRTALVPYLSTVSAAYNPFTPVVDSNGTILPCDRVAQPPAASVFPLLLFLYPELQQRIPVIINQVIQQPSSVVDQVENESATSTDHSDGSDPGSLIRSLEVQQDDDNEDVVVSGAFASYTSYQ